MVYAKRLHFVSLSRDEAFLYVTVLPADAAEYYAVQEYEQVQRADFLHLTQSCPKCRTTNLKLIV